MFRVKVLFLLSLLSLIVSPLATSHPLNNGGGNKMEVTYDGRSLIIGGKRDLFYSGSIHYTRSTPDMWPDLLDKSKRGGINVIQTYVFWNAHEVEKGQFKFDTGGPYDVVKFLKLVQERGMYVTLRLGPFIQAEWNHGGLPYWLREVPNIIFRSFNEPFKKYMQEFVTSVVSKMKEEKLFYPQGGPIILAQIENEYNHVQLAYEEDGDNYVQWAAKLAVGLDCGIPWVMCKQKDAPDPVINACNGRHCGDTFSGPNKPYKPQVWTENWTAQYRVFGDPPSQRSAEDIAFSIVRFFSKNGSLVNYYMYHGGTNFGRTSASFKTTRYYDEAPLDEYGLQRDPKWGHLRDGHRAMNLCKRILLNGATTVNKLTEFNEVRTFEKGDGCVAFLTNNHTKEDTTINFRGIDYFLPPRSISVLGDCKNVIYNTQMIASQHNSRNYKTSKQANNHKWEMFVEEIPTTTQLKPDKNAPQELYGLLKDLTDYGWFTTSFELGPEDFPKKDGTSPVLRILSLGHTLCAYVNGEYIGSGHGSHEEKAFEFQRPVKFKIGTNQISILATTVGLPDSGAYMEHRYAGPKSVTILGLNTGTIDLTHNGWGHQVGIQGEKLEVFTDSGSKKVKWTDVQGPAQGLRWYKTQFTTPEGRDPVAIRMTGMGKGMMYVNGNNIGRHWMSFLSILGKPTQSEYHIPRSYLNPRDNMLVVLEEEPACPDKIVILNVDRNTICSLITEHHPANVNSWEVKGQKLKPVADVPPEAGATLVCPDRSKITAIEFASFGDPPTGVCGEYVLGKCNSPEAKQIVEQECVGKESCFLPLSKFNNAGSDCKALVKTLAIQANCAPQSPAM